jgi:hypothetical protein
MIRFIKGVVVGVAVVGAILILAPKTHAHALALLAAVLYVPGALAAARWDRRTEARKLARKKAAQSSGFTYSR